MAPNQPFGPAGPGPASTPPGGEPLAPVQRPEGYEVQQYERGGLFGGIVDQVQRWGLADGLTMRPAADIPRTNARSYEHPELKAMIDTSTQQQVDQLGEMWNKLGNDIMDFGANLHRTATSIDAVWEGEAGLAARNMLVKLAKWSEQTGRGVQYMGTTMRTQGDAAGKAKADMPEPVPYEPTVYQERINSTNNPFQWIQILGDARENFEQSNAAHEEAIRVTETYSTSLHSTNGTMPAFTPPPEFGSGDTSLTPGKPTPGGGGGLGGAVPSVGGAGGGAPGIGGTAPSSVGDRPPASTPGQVAPSGPNPGSPGIPPGGRPPGRGGDGGVPAFLPAAGIGAPGRPVPGGRPMPGGGRGPGGGFGRGGGEFGPRGSAGTSNPPGHPNSPGRGGGPMGAAEAIGRGAAGPAGRGAGPGGAFPPMASAGHGQGEEDIEHRRPSYLIETEDIWGDGRRVAPPVIGEDPPDYYPKDKR